MKGLFVFRNECIGNEFPLEVTANCTAGFGVKGKLFFKSEEAEKIEREEMDKGIKVEIAGESCKLSDLMYKPYSFAKAGNDFLEPYPPVCV